MYGRRGNSWSPNPATDTAILSGKFCAMRSLSALVNDRIRCSVWDLPHSISTAAMGLPLRGGDLTSRAPATSPIRTRWTMDDSANRRAANRRTMTTDGDDRRAGGGARPSPHQFAHRLVEAREGQRIHPVGEQLPD